MTTTSFDNYGIELALKDQIILPSYGDHTVTKVRSSSGADVIDCTSTLYPNGYGIIRVSTDGGRTTHTLLMVLDLEACEGDKAPEGTMSPWTEFQQARYKALEQAGTIEGFNESEFVTISTSTDKGHVGTMTNTMVLHADGTGHLVVEVSHDDQVLAVIKYKIIYQNTERNASN